MEKLRKDVAQLRGQKLHRFDDFEGVLRRIRHRFGNLFPNLTINKKGSKYVYDFGVPELNPISIEKEHGSRDCIPRYYAKLGIMGIEEVLSYIESRADVTAIQASAEETGEKEVGNEEPGALPQPEVPDGTDRG